MVYTFAMHGLRLALDVESGALHVLDEDAFFAVRWLATGAMPYEVERELVKRIGTDEARLVMDEIRELKEKGILFSKKRDVADTGENVVKALCLHLAHDCNLRCTYCFAGEGHYGGSRGLMPLETAKKAVEFLLANSQGRKHCEIDFFGGEPLLNFEVLKETVTYGRARAEELGKILKFTVTTNALRVPPEVRDYLKQENISIVLSLDGREEVHDRMRKLPGGGGSWQQVLDNCKAIVADRGGDNYYLRGTYTRHNLDFANDVAQMIDEGFKQISLEPAVLSPEAAEALRAEDLPQIFAEYERLVRMLWDLESMGRNVFFFHFELDLDKGPCAKKRSQGCGAGSAYLAVTPDGRLYPCHQFAGEEDFCAGHVDTGINSEVLAKFAGLDTVEKKTCKKCFARYFCGGGCHAAAWNMSGDLTVPYALGCELHKKRVECGLYLQARRMLAKTSG
ncbi:MAG: thioether cross-link-forming SCIFF peptide maturase [Bacillota bacterium]|nr:thioether cross-link-forming SCIFF peptide maturase [Bacillota bacterium]MDW7684605.1 thioether cross-link-forming SCIFF peptide maturase [Bacillota bacterium]